MKIRYITITTIMVLLVFLFGSTVFIDAYDKTYTVYMVGQGHQDTGWTLGLAEYYQSNYQYDQYTVNSDE